MARPAPCTPDGLPVIERVRGIDNAVLATGHGKWGLQLAPLTGRLVASVVAAERPDHDLYPLRSDRFRLLPSPRTQSPLDTLRDAKVAA